MAKWCHIKHTGGKKKSEKMYIYQILTTLYQLSHFGAKIRIHLHGNSWPTFVHTFQCLLSQTSFWTYDICQACIFMICAARQVRTPPHVLHWPTFFKLVDTFHLIMLHDQHLQHFVHCWLVSCFIIAYCSWPCYGTPSLVKFSTSCRGPHQT